MHSAADLADSRLHTLSLQRHHADDRQGEALHGEMQERGHLQQWPLHLSGHVLRNLLRTQAYFPFELLGKTHTGLGYIWIVYAVLIIAIIGLAVFTYLIRQSMKTGASLNKLTDNPEHDARQTPFYEDPAPPSAATPDNWVPENFDPTSTPDPRTLGQPSGTVLP
jgi:hypothetical protein